MNCPSIIISVEIARIVLIKILHLPIDEHFDIILRITITFLYLLVNHGMFHCLLLSILLIILWPVYQHNTDNLVNVRSNNSACVDHCRNFICRYEATISSCCVSLLCDGDDLGWVGLDAKEAHDGGK